MDEKKTLELSDAVKNEYAKANSAVQEQLLRIGSLEAEYLVAKNGAMLELDKRNKARMDLLTKAAKDAGLDVDNQKWMLDVPTMTLVKQ